GFGLEAGSKPELMAVLALSRPGGLIVCNGYKDREYIRLALIGRKLGLQTTANAGGVHNLQLAANAGSLHEIARQMGDGLLVTELMGQ
uniref:metallopeptidase TldD-related protein n=1 Tax=Enterobacter hormaechei TaxID=158836 RepID=UPI001EF91660